MLILIEGVDKCGKSTIGKDIRDATVGLCTFKNVIKPEDKKEATIGRTSGIYIGAYQFALCNSLSTLFDRSHITEIVYSSRRGYESIAHIDWKFYENTILKGQTLLIYMTAPAKVIAERFITEKEDYVSQDEIQTLLDRYETYLATTELPLLRLSSLDSRQENLRKAIDKMRELGY